MRRSVLATVKSAAIVVGSVVLAALGIGSVAQGADTATPVARPTPPSYTSHALGVLPGDNESAGYGVNDAGSVVGYSSPGGGQSLRAFYWDRPTGVLHQLTTSLPNSFAFAIAGGGPGATAYAVGYEYSPAEPGTYALIWKIVAPSPSGPITLDAIPLDVERSIAVGVNDNGIAVGAVGETPIPAIWSPDGDNSYARTDIALLPNHDRGGASDINNDGIVVGSSHELGTPPFRRAHFCGSSMAACLNSPPPKAISAARRRR